MPAGEAANRWAWMSGLRLENFNGSLSTHKPQHSRHHPDTTMEIEGVYARALGRMNVVGG